MFYVAVDQYGDTYPYLKFPRKELLERLGRKHADKMYIDKEKKPFHCGYIIAGRWCRLYEMVPFLKPLVPSKHKVLSANDDDPTNGRE